MSFQPDSSLTRGFIVPKARTRQADGDLLHPYSIGVGFLPRGAGLSRVAGVALGLVSAGWLGAASQGVVSDCWGPGRTLTYAGFVGVSP